MKVVIKASSTMMKADVTMIAYLLRSAKDHRVLRILSDDTDVLVIVIYFVWKTGLHHTCLVQLEHWNGNVIDINADAALAPPGLLDVLSCGCKAEGKACSSTACSCHKNQLSCTTYCICGGADDCRNPFLFTASSQADEADDSDYSAND